MMRRRSGEGRVDDAVLPDLASVDRVSPVTPSSTLHTYFSRSPDLMVSSFFPLLCAAFLDRSWETGEQHWGIPPSPWKEASAPSSSAVELPKLCTTCV